MRRSQLDSTLDPWFLHEVTCSLGTYSCILSTMPTQVLFQVTPTYARVVAVGALVVLFPRVPMSNVRTQRAGSGGLVVADLTDKGPLPRVSPQVDPQVTTHHAFEGAVGTRVTLDPIVRLQ